MVNLGSDEIIKYPFLDEAGKYLSDKGFSLEDFATNTDLKKIVENAFERITTAVDGRIYKSELPSNNSSTPVLSPFSWRTKRRRSLKKQPPKRRTMPSM